MNYIHKAIAPIAQALYHGVHHLTPSDIEAIIFWLVMLYVAFRGFTVFKRLLANYSSRREQSRRLTNNKLPGSPSMGEPGNLATGEPGNLPTATAAPPVPPCNPPAP